MAAPTRVSSHQQASSPYTTTGTSKTCTGVTFQVGDYLEVKASAEQHGTSATVTPTLSAGAATWTKYADQGTGTSQSGAWSWVGVVTTAATNATVTLARPTGSNVQWGFSVTVIRGASGIGVRFEGNNGITSSAPGVTQTVQANSLLTCQSNDWNAVDGLSRTWRTVNGSPIAESSYYRSASTHTIYGGYVLDSGAGGSVTMGLTAPATQRWVMSGFEFLGTTGGTTQAAAGTVAATTSIAGSTLARLVAAGALVATTAAAASAAALLGASGVAAASSTVTGSATVLRPAAGTAGATSTVTGSAEVAAQSYPAAGTIAATSDTTGSATMRLPAGGAVNAASTTTAAATARLAASGTVAASTTVAASASVLGGPVAHPAAGTVAATSTTSGAVRLRATAAGTAPVVTTTTGAGFALYRVGGSVAATSAVTGSADIALDPDQLPVVEVGTMQPARFTAAPAIVAPTVTATAVRFVSGTPLPPRYTRRT